MRISTRLLVNAVSTYSRLGVNFAIGVFLTWYVIGHVGLVGFGAVALATGSFGLTTVLFNAIRSSMVRELAAAIASGEPSRVRRTVTSALAFSSIAAVVVLAIFAVVCGLALLDVFHTPDDLPDMRYVLAALFASSGIVTALNVWMAPFTMAIVASQRVELENMAVMFRRALGPVAAILAFDVLRPDGTLSEKLLALALVSGGLGVVEVCVKCMLARLVVPHLHLRPGEFDRAEFRSVASTVWNASQFTIATGLNMHLMMLLINLMFGLAFNGMWQIVIQVGGHARMVAQGLLAGIDPMTTHLHERGEHEAIAYLLARVMRYQLCVILPFVAFYMIFMTPILDLWVGDRLAGDVHLMQAGLTVDAALRLIAIMASITLIGEVAWAAVGGVERMLFGMGQVRSYAWFAKWSLLITLGASAALMWWLRTPIAAAVVVATMNIIYFEVLILRQALRHMGMRLRDVLGRALPRPVILTVLLSGPLIAARMFIDELTLSGLAILCGATGAGFLLLAIPIGLDRAERTRLGEILSRK